MLHLNATFLSCMHLYVEMFVVVLSPIAIMCMSNMFGTYFTILFILAENCTDGEMRLSNGSTSYYPSGYSEYSGRVEVCVNGEFVDVCPGPTDAQQVCSSLGYPGIL